MENNPDDNEEIQDNRHAGRHSATFQCPCRVTDKNATPVKWAILGLTVFALVVMRLRSFFCIII